jgi:hypothetical protein
MENPHICMSEYSMLPSMKEFYSLLNMLPTSTAADTVLIRSHIAYWSGHAKADRASIKPSRGCSYRIALYGKHDKHDTIVKIRDYYDHREGVVGYYAI